MTRCEECDRELDEADLMEFDQILLVCPDCFVLLAESDPGPVDVRERFTPAEPASYDN
jgi:hypothetical protein